METVILLMGSPEIRVVSITLPQATRHAEDLKVLDPIGSTLRPRDDVIHMQWEPNNYFGDERYGELEGPSNQPYLNDVIPAGMSIENPIIRSWNTSKTRGRESERIKPAGTSPDWHAPSPLFSWWSGSISPASVGRCGYSRLATAPSHETTAGPAAAPRTNRTVSNGSDTLQAAPHREACWVESQSVGFRFTLIRCRQSVDSPRSKWRVPVSLDQPVDETGG